MEKLTKYIIYFFISLIVSNCNLKSDSDDDDDDDDGKIQKNKKKKDNKNYNDDEKDNNDNKKKNNYNKENKNQDNDAIDEDDKDKKANKDETENKKNFKFKSKEERFKELKKRTKEFAKNIDNSSLDKNQKKECKDILNKIIISNSLNGIKEELIFKFIDNLLDDFKMNKKLLETFLDSNNININNNGQTLLKVSYIKKTQDITKIIKFLLRKGAKVDYKDISLVSILESIKKEALELLLGKISVNSISKNGDTFLTGHILDIEKLKVFIEKGADVNLQNNKGNTPLHILIKYGEQKDILEKVKLLLQSGAKTRIKNKEGKTPLYYAHKEGYTEIIDLITKHEKHKEKMFNEFKNRKKEFKTIIKNASMAASKKENALKKIDKITKYKSPYDIKENLVVKTLNSFIKVGNEDIIRSFVKCINVNAINKIGSTVMYFLPDNINKKIFKLFLDNGANLNYKSQKFYFNILFFYYFNKEPIFYQLLLKENLKIDWNFQHAQQNLLHFIFDDTNIDTNQIKLLLKKNINVNQRCFGQTPLHFLIQNEDIKLAQKKELIKLLLEAGADPYIIDNDGKTPIDLIKNNELLEFIKSKIK